MTGVRASVVRSLRRSPGRVGFGLGLVTVLLLWAEAWAPHPAGDTLWFAVPWWATLIGIGMATALVARGRWGWGGLIAALVCGATLLGVADALLQPDNPYTQGLFMGLAIDVFVGWWTVGASIGVAMVSAARWARSIARSRGGAATTSVGVDEPPESAGGEGAADSASGPRPARDRRPRGLVAVALVGVIALAALAIWQPWNPPGPAYFPFPSVPAPACQPPASADKDGQTLTFDWQVAVETDRPRGSAVLFVSGPDTLLCFVSRSDDGSLGMVSTGLGGHRGDTRTGLTLDMGMGGPAQAPDILVGRIPTGTATVRVGIGDGSEETAALRNGYYLAWLSVPADPVRIDALDAGGHLLGRLADANGLHIPS